MDEKTLQEVFDLLIKYRNTQIVRTSCVYSNKRVQKAKSNIKKIDEVLEKVGNVLDSFD